MFLIAAHNKDSYLHKINSILQERGIKETFCTNRDALRTSAGSTPQLQSQVSALHYDKVLIATIRRENFSRLYEALNVIHNSQEIKKENGFITTVPFENIVGMSQERREGQMQVSDYLQVKFVCSALQATNRDDAIRELAALVKGSPEINDFDKFVNDLFERENMNTTGIGYNVAIPHARTDAVNKFIIVIGRSRQGIDFSSIDNQPVQLILLMGIPNSIVKGYLQILAYLTRQLKKDEVRNRLINAANEQEIVSIFQQLNHH